MFEQGAAHISRRGSRVEAVFERRLEHGPAEVWRALVEPERLSNWLAPGEIELRLGGSARLDFVNSGVRVESVVTAFRPVRLLEYSWSGPGEPQRPVRWRLTPAGPRATDLSLRLTLPGHEDIARSCAGWDAHLEMLAAALEGVEAKFPFDHFKARREFYQHMLEPA